jgi:hypothetical protein
MPGKKLLPWSLLGAWVFLGLLWRLGFPQPNYDDLFYSGAALHLADGGDFSNPLLARQGFPGHYFFVYPPLHSYVFAGWLKIFGINAISVPVFPIVCLAVICAATIAILRRHQAPAWVEWLVPLGVSFGLLPLGLRPETLAVALTMSGFALTEWSGTSRARLGAGFFLLFLGASCAPRVTVYAGALAGYAALAAWRANDRSRKAGQMILILSGGALLAAGLIFLTLIGFQVGDFWSTFHFHAARVVGKSFELIRDYVLHFLGVLQWPLILLPFGLLVFILRKPKDGLGRAGMVLAGAFVVAAFVGGVGNGTIWWAIVTMLLFAGAAARHLKRAGVVILAMLTAGSLVVANRKLAMNCFGLVMGKIVADADDQDDAALSLRPTAEHPLLVDGAVARYVFDYRLPEGSLDLSFGAPFPGGLPGDLESSELRKGDVYLAGPDTVNLLTSVTLLELPTPKWRAFGLRSFQFEKFPRHVYIIPAEDCKASRDRPDAQRPWIPKAPARK